MKAIHWRAILGWIVLGCCLQACHLTWVRRIHLDAELLNDRNQLLIVEGRSNLPDEALIEARLLDKDGRRWSSGKGLIQNGRYYIILEVSRCPGFRPLDLNLFFDPLVASAKVQRYTGTRGQAMEGPLVVDSHDRAMVLLRKRVVLTMSARQANLRRLEAGDGDIDELQSYLARHPNDAHSLIGLGLAFLKQRPSQRYKDSEAYKMLREGIRHKPAETNLEMEARLWVARLEDKDRREKEERERAKAPSYSARFQDQHLVRPGEALGAFELGMGRSFLAMSFRLQPSDQPNVAFIQEFPGLRLTFSTKDGKLERIATQDTRFRTQEGIGPGSDLEDLKRVVPGLTIRFGPEETRADGRVYSTTTVPLEGIDLLVERSYDPIVPIPQATIREIEVFAPTP